jgi:hypothetical protein
MIRATALRRLALTLVAALGPAACGLNQEGVAPPNNTFFYPSAATLDRSAGWLYVANSNADLRYNDGTLVMVNVGDTQADGVIPPDPVLDPSGQPLPIFSAAADRTVRAAQWGPCPAGDYVNTPRTLSKNLSDVHFCCWDNIDVNILNCDERAYIPANSSVRIGSFTANIVRQERKCAVDDQGNPCDCTDLSANDPPPDDRLYLAVRGDTSLTYIDASRVDTHDTMGDLPTLNCSSPTGSFAVCDDDHRFTGATPGLATITPSDNPPSIPFPNEPYALAVDDTQGLLFVGHLTGDTSHSYTGGYSLFDIAPQGDIPAIPPPVFISPFPSPFPANASGLVGITTLKQANPTSSVVYATSRYLSQVEGLSTLGACPIPGLRKRDVVGAPNGELYDTRLIGAETRGIEFVSPDPSNSNAPLRPFVLQRTPPALVMFDGTLAVSALETCQGPTFLYKSDAGIGDRLFVNCFDTGEVYVFDPTVPRLEATFTVGRGPAGMIFPKVAYPQVAYVIDFGDNDISVVDLQPGSPTEYHVIQRIGFPSEVPR